MGYISTTSENIKVVKQFKDKTTYKWILKVTCKACTKCYQEEIKSSVKCPSCGEVAVFDDPNPRG